MEEPAARNMQSIAFDFINSTNKNIFLTGGAGTGKTTFLKFLKETTSKKLAIAAPTGVAAIQAGGTTIHELFSLPARKLDQQNMMNIRMSAQSKDLLRQLDVLVIDEASMLRADILDAIDMLLRNIRASDKPLGGLQIVFIGDLYQLPPVEQSGDREKFSQAYSNQYFTGARVFPALAVLQLELQQVHRQSDRQFIDLLNAVRTGKLTGSELQKLNHRYDPTLNGGSGAIMLTTHNRYAADLNTARMNEIPGEAQIFTATVTGEFPEDHFPVEKTLALKTGCQVMIVKNDLSASRSFFNGKIGTISAMTAAALRVEFGDGSNVTLEKEIWSNIGYAGNGDQALIKEELKGTFTQFPVRLGWAITVHKSQGLTFERAVIDVAEAFAPGQVYVALSRVRSLEGITLRTLIPAKAIMAPQIEATAFIVIPGGAVETVLDAAKTGYFLTLLQQTFDYSTVLASVSNTSLSGSIKDDLSRALLKIQDLGVRFQREITDKLRTNSSADWGAIKERIDKASAYFKGELENLCINPLKVFTAKFKNDFIYRAEVNAGKALLRELWIKVRQTDALAATLAGLMKSTEYRFTGAEAKEARASQIFLHAGHQTRRFETTEEQTLQLFLQGKTVSEIAKARALGEAAIQYHLSSFLATGEVRIQHIIPEALLSEVLALTGTATGWSLPKLLSLVGNRLSMGQIQALMTYLSLQ